MSPALCDPMDCSQPGSSVHGFSRQEYWSGLPFPSPGQSSWTKDRTWVSYRSCIGRQVFFTTSATWKAPIGTLCTFNPLNNLCIAAEDTETQSSPRDRGSMWQREELIPSLPNSRVTQESWYFSLKWKEGKLQTAWFGGLPFWPSPACYSTSVQFSSVAQSRPTLRPHESQHTRPPCPSPTPGVHPNSCPLSWLCHPAISSSVIPFSSCPQSSPASGYFQMSQLFTSGGQSIGVSASTSVLPMNTQDLSPLGWTGWISLQSKGLSRVISNTTVQKHQFFSTQLSSWSNSHIHTWPLEKP